MENSDFNAESMPSVVDSEVAEAIDNSAIETDPAEVEAVEQSVSQEAPAKPRQSAEENRRFAAMRRENERLKAELETSRKDNSRLFSVLNADGYTGSDAQSLADAVEAAKEGISPEQIRLRREDRARELAEAIRNDPEFIRNKKDAEQLRSMVYRQQIDRDVAEIKSRFPDADIKDADDLGNAYRTLRGHGIDNITAYLATVGSAKLQEPDPVPQTGAVSGAKVTPEKEYYTSDELDKLSSKDLDDEETWQRALRSLQKLK